MIFMDNHVSHTLSPSREEGMHPHFNPRFISYKIIVIIKARGADEKNMEKYKAIFCSYDC